MKTKFVFAVVAMIICGCFGCDNRSRHHYPEPKPCTCETRPVGYVVNLEFTDHKNKLRSFPHKINFYNGWEVVPNALYRTMGTSQAQISYYYSLAIPERQSNGLISIIQVDGPIVYIDFKDIEVTTIPCKPKPPNAYVIAHKEYGNKWLKYKEEECPAYHSMR